MELNKYKVISKKFIRIQVKSEPTAFLLFHKASFFIETRKKLSGILELSVLIRCLVFNKLEQENQE